MVMMMDGVKEALDLTLLHLRRLARGGFYPAHPTRAIVRLRSTSRGVEEEVQMELRSDAA